MKVASTHWAITRVITSYSIHYTKLYDIDKETNEPVVGANVVIEGTYYGAATDLDGYFYINNVTPGKYTVIISAIGYHKVTVENVVVRIDLTTNLDAQLTSEAITLGEVVVQASYNFV